MPEFITKKTSEEIKILREGGRILAKVLSHLKKYAKPGITPLELDQLANRLLLENGAEPAFKGYTPHPHSKPFPATVCISVNFTVVHGIPNERPLEVGDIVSFDLGVKYKGLFTDAALTIGIGKISAKLKKFKGII